MKREKGLNFFSLSVFLSHSPNPFQMPESAPPPPLPPKKTSPPVPVPVPVPASSHSLEEIVFSFSCLRCPECTIAPLASGSTGYLKNLFTCTCDTCPGLVLPFDMPATPKSCTVWYSLAPSHPSTSPSPSIVHTVHMTVDISTLAPHSIEWIIFITAAFSSPYLSSPSSSSSSSHAKHYFKILEESRTAQRKTFPVTEGQPGPESALAVALAGEPGIMMFEIPSSPSSPSMYPFSHMAVVGFTSRAQRKAFKKAALALKNKDTQFTFSYKFDDTATRFIPPSLPSTTPPSTHKHFTWYLLDKAPTHPVLPVFHLITPETETHGMVVSKHPDEWPHVPQMQAFIARFSSSVFLATKDDKLKKLASHLLVHLSRMTFPDRDAFILALFLTNAHASGAAGTPQCYSRAVINKILTYIQEPLLEPENIVVSLGVHESHVFFVHDPEPESTLSTPESAPVPEESDPDADIPRPPLSPGEKAVEELVDIALEMHTLPNFDLRVDLKREWISEQIKDIADHFNFYYGDFWVFQSTYSAKEPYTLSRVHHENVLMPTPFVALYALSPMSPAMREFIAETIKKHYPCSAKIIAPHIAYKNEPLASEL